MFIPINEDIIRRVGANAVGGGGLGVAGGGIGAAARGVELEGARAGAAKGIAAKGGGMGVKVAAVGGKAGGIGAGACKVGAAKTVAMTVPVKIAAATAVGISTLGTFALMGTLGLTGYAVYRYSMKRRAM